MNNTYTSLVNQTYHFPQEGFEVDDNGYVKNVNIITPTAQSLANLEDDISAYIPSILSLSEKDKEKKKKSLERERVQKKRKKDKKEHKYGFLLISISQLKSV